MAKRPSLTSLPIAARTVQKPTTAPALIVDREPNEQASAPGAGARRVASETERRTRDIKSVMVRVGRAGWRELRKLSADLDMGMQDLGVEALNDLLVKHGRPPVVEARIYRKDYAKDAEAD